MPADTYELFKDTPSRVVDLVMDIAAGICYSQKAWDAQFGTYDLSKVKEYKQKTELPQIIEDALRDSDYKKAYEWKNDKEFSSDGISFNVVDYSIETFEYCLVEMDGEKVKMTKKCLREWWDETR